MAREILPRHARAPQGGGSKQSQKQWPRTENKQFIKSTKMASIKSQQDGNRQSSAIATNEEYLGLPPLTRCLIQNRLLIPGKDMIPRGLDSPIAMDGIRKSHKVWITRVKSNVFDIHSDSITRLQEATQAINWEIHALRLSNKHHNTEFFVQDPARAYENALIRVSLGSRPCLTPSPDGPCDMLTPQKACLRQLRPYLNPSAAVLNALGSSLKMRVNFGRVNVRQRKRGLADELNYNAFGDMIKAYSARGGADLDTWLADVQVTESVLRSLTDVDFGICNAYDINYGYNLVLKADGRECVAEAFAPFTTDTRFSITRVSKPEAWARLNWTVSAPDMKFDWNLRVDAHEAADPSLSQFKELVDGISLTFNNQEDDLQKILKTPRLTISKLAKWENKVSETRLKTMAKVAINETPYVIEISITQAWSGLKTATAPRVGWGIEIYGVDWDEIMNQENQSERRRDWGADLEGIWKGPGQSLEQRFGDFLQIILKTQSVLENADTVVTSS